MNEDNAPVPRLVPQAKLRRMRGIAWRIVDEEAVLVNVRQDEVIHLDAVSTFIWSRMDGLISLGEIAEDLVEEFEVDLETATEDTRAFAGRLLEQGAAEIVELER